MTFEGKVTELAILASVTGIDMKATGQTLLLTVPTGKKCVITNAIIRATAVDTVTVVPIISIGQGGSFNDLVGATSLTGLNGQFAIDLFSSIGANTYTVYNAGDQIQLNIATGATATTLTGAIELMGYYA